MIVIGKFTWADGEIGLTMIRADERGRWSYEAKGYTPTAAPWQPPTDIITEAMRWNTRQAAHQFLKGMAGHLRTDAFKGFHIINVGQLDYPPTAPTAPAAPEKAKRIQKLTKGKGKRIQKLTKRK